LSASITDRKEMQTVPLKFLCKKAYGRTIFYPMCERSTGFLKIFRRTAISGIANMGVLKNLIPIDIEYEKIEWKK